MTDEKLNHAAMNLVGELQLTKPENYYEVARRLMQKYAAAEIEALQKENAELRQRLIKEHLPAGFESWEKVWQNRVEMSNELTSLHSTVAELEKDKHRLLRTFQHTHKNNGQDDSCDFCGLDLRDEIHIRAAAMSAKK